MKKNDMKSQASAGEGNGMDAGEEEFSEEWRTGPILTMLAVERGKAPSFAVALNCGTGSSFLNVLRIP
jgi:hypothetical protein